MVTPVAKPIISTLTIPSTRPIQPEKKQIEKQKILCPRCSAKRASHIIHCSIAQSIKFNIN